jgi:predicted restriction endonuclease
MPNGLLLIPNLDSLFDKGFISFDRDGAILLSPQLSSAVADQLGVKKTMRLHHIYPEHQPYLEFHRTKVFRKTL